jgi:antirestriction protein ArdC
MFPEKYKRNIPMAKFNTQNKTPRRDYYQELTDQIIAALETGTKPWQRPWDPTKAVGPAAPVNATTGQPYHGINVLILAMSPLAFTTSDPRFVTFKQAQSQGWQIREGVHGTHICKYGTIEKDNDNPKNPDDTVKRISYLKFYTVFHASQIAGIPDYVPPFVPKPLWQRVEDADLILRNSRVPVRTGGGRARYSPSTDHIQLPPDNAFYTREGWAAIALHELGHATGHSSRLNRDLTGSFGSKKYAYEELIADLCSLFLGSTLGLPVDVPNHASYIQSWVSVLKNDSRAIFHAAAQAQKAADYCLNFHPGFADFDKDQASSEESEQNPTVGVAA